MARKKKTNDVDDWKRYNKFKDENIKLRKEVSKLRKLVKDSHEDVLEERQLRVDEGLPPVLPMCEVCGNNDLKNIPIVRKDGSFNMRLCNSCGHRHPLKKLKEPKT